MDKRAIVAAVVGGLILGPLVTATLGVFFSGLTEVPADFLTSILTFDGIMIAVTTLSFPQFDSVLTQTRQKRTATRMLWTLTIMFIVSAIAALYSLARANSSLTLESSVALGTAADSSPVVWALDLTILGLTGWLIILGVVFLLRRDGIPR